MDLSNLQDNYKLILETIAIILVLYCLSFLYKTTTNPPEASGAWPLIGHYKVFSGSDLPHVPLSSMADRYEPIFTVRLGIRKVLVVSSWEIVKDIFTTHDLNVSNRPNYIATNILGHNGAFFFLSLHMVHIGVEYVKSSPKRFCLKVDLRSLIIFKSLN
ncbi:putative cytochrome P450 [Helianthus anomalus]